jgi:hypothetical protein
MKLEGIPQPKLGKDYGGLSNLTHSTKSAASNSAIVVAARHGSNSQAIKKIIESKEAYEQEEIGTMYRFLWLFTEERKGLIVIGSDLTKMPSSNQFILEFGKSNFGRQRQTQGRSVGVI